MKAKAFTIFPCALEGVRAVAMRTRHRFPKHTHGEFGIGVIDRGAQKSLSSRGMVEAGPGDVITVNPEEVHDGVPIGETDRCWKMLYFEPAAITGALRDISLDRISSRELANPVMTDRRLASLFQYLFSSLASGEAAIQEERFLPLIAAAFREAAAPETKPPVPYAIRHARAWIDDDPSASGSLADLAQMSGLSRFQLIRAFTRVTGLTPHAYIVQQRLRKARRLIGSGMPLAEAAITSGFADQSHMTRCFTGIYGIPPGAYATAAA